MEGYPIPRTVGLFAALITLLSILSPYQAPSLASESVCSEESVLNAQSLDEASAIVQRCPQNPAVIHAFGLRLSRKGLYDKGLVWLQKALRMDPEDRGYAADYVTVLCWAGRYRKAMQAYQGFFSSEKPPGYLYRHIARAAYSLADYTLAARLYKEALEAKPGDTEALKGLVFSLCRLQRFDEARALVRKGLAKDQVNPGLIDFLTFYIDLSRGDITKAYASWNKAWMRPKGPDPDWTNSWVSAIQSAPPDTIEDLLRLLHKERSPSRDRFLILASRGRYKQAVDLLAGSKDEKPGDWPVFYRNWQAWSLFKTNRPEQAVKVYQEILKEDPGNRQAQTGLVYCLCALGQNREAKGLLERLMKNAPHDLDLLFAKAFYHEKNRDFLKAIGTYEEILSLYPTNQAAGRLILRAYSDLGLPSVALERGISKGRPDPLLTEFRLDMARYRLQWGLAREAELILKDVQSKYPDNKRAAFDLVTALAAQNRYSEALSQYQALLSKGLKPPYWAKQAAADSLLALERPNEAIRLYRDVLRMVPRSFQARMGLFYALQEARRWKETWDLLEAMDRETPTGHWSGRRFIPNWDKMEVGLARGWLLAYEDRLEEAQNYLEDLKERAPGNNGTRVALGHLYLWRGWPRKAWTELSIANTREPSDPGISVGLIYTLDALGHHREARSGITELSKRYPANKHVKQLAEKLSVDDMREIAVDTAMGFDDDGAGDWSFRVEGSRHWSLGRRLYSYLYWQKGELDDISDTYWRMGLGIRHRINPSWYWEGEISGDLEGHDGTGVAAWTAFTPDDYWEFSAGYNSFSTDIQLRARTEDITSDETWLRTAYRWSEWRWTSIKASFRSFSDRNNRYSLLCNYTQGLWVGRDWISRLMLDIYASHGTRKDAPYFNPRNDFSISMTHLLQRTSLRLYNRSIIHRLFVTLGMYFQQGFSGHAISSMRYEQERTFGLRQSLLCGMELSHNVYDGEPVTGFSLDLSYRYRF